MRRPLFAALAGIAAAVWLTVFLIPWCPRDYEPLRGSRLFLDGNVCGLESKREGDSIVYPNGVHQSLLVNKHLKSI